MENRTVLDTNIWVDFFISKRTRELIELIDQNKAVFLRSKPAIAEFERVLSYEKFKKYKFNVVRTLAFYEAMTKYVETQELFKDCPDKKDNFLFDLAIQGNTKYLVSRDKTVLATPIPGTHIKKMTFPQFKEDIQ